MGEFLLQQLKPGPPVIVLFPFFQVQISVG
jgi:hypothetical protein